MILYTERQLKIAYIQYVREVEKQNYAGGVQIPVPCLEEFRLMYEEDWESYYDGSS